MGGPMRAMITIFTLKDDLEQWRIEKFFQALMHELYEGHKYLNATDVSIIMLLRLIKRSAIIQNIMAKQTKRYGWIIEYIACRKEGTTIPNSMVYKSKAANLPFQNAGDIGFHAASSSLPQKSPFVVPKETWEGYLTYARMIISGKLINSGS